MVKSSKSDGTLRKHAPARSDHVKGRQKGGRQEGVGRGSEKPEATRRERERRQASCANLSIDEGVPKPMVGKGPDPPLFPRDVLVVLGPFWDLEGRLGTVLGIFWDNFGEDIIILGSQEVASLAR